MPKIKQNKNVVMLLELRLYTKWYDNQSLCHTERGQGLADKA